MDTMIHGWYIKSAICVNECIHYTTKHSKIIMSTQTGMKILNLSTFEVITITDVYYCPEYILSVDNTIYFINDCTNYKIFEINMTTQITKSYQMGKIKNGADKMGELIHLKQNNALLLLGGVGETVSHKFDIENKCWTDVTLHGLPELHNFGVLKTFDDRYLLVFGGMHFDLATNRIYRIDTNTWDVKVSDEIKCPYFGGCHVTLLNNDQNDILTQGYVRDFEKGDPSQMHIPCCIRREIHLFYVNGATVHYFHNGFNFTVPKHFHYSIELQTLLDSF
eukprot:402833_1